MQRSSAVKSVVEFIVNHVVLDAESEAVSFMQDGYKPKNAFKKAGLWYTVTKTAKDYRRVVRRSQRLTGKADKKERQQKLLKVSRWCACGGDSSENLVLNIEVAIDAKI